MGRNVERGGQGRARSPEHHRWPRPPRRPHRRRDSQAAAALAGMAGQLRIFTGNSESEERDVETQEHAKSDSVTPAAPRPACRERGRPRSPRSIAREPVIPVRGHGGVQLVGQRIGLALRSVLIPISRMAFSSAGRTGVDQPTSSTRPHVSPVSRTAKLSPARMEEPGRMFVRGLRISHRSSREPDRPARRREVRRCRSRSSSATA